MGSIAFFNVILLKSLLTKREARKVMGMVRFSQKNVETIPLTYLFRQRVMTMGRLCASSSLACYRRLEKAKLTSC